MKAATFVLVLFLGLWMLLAAYLIGAAPGSTLLPEAFNRLALPKSTMDLGDSLSILDGIFSSIAIVLGLVAIIFQSKELKESTRAQSEQARSLAMANTLAAYTARLQYLIAEMERLGKDIDRLKPMADQEPQKTIYQRTVNKRRDLRSEAEEINQMLLSNLRNLQAILNETEKRHRQ